MEMKPVGATDTLQVAMIGAGKIATDWHGQIISAHPQAEVVAVADPLPGKARDLADLFGGSECRTYLRYQDIDWNDVDLVVISVPTPLHYEAAKAALEAGKHVFCEKPPTSTVEQAEDLARLAAEKDVALVYGFHQVFMVPADALRQIGEMGSAVIKADVEWLGRHRRPWWGSFGDPSKNSAISDLGSHPLTVGLFLMAVASASHLSASPSWPVARYVTGHSLFYREVGEGIGLFGPKDPEVWETADVEEATVEFEGAALWARSAYVHPQREDERVTVSLLFENAHRLELRLPTSFTPNAYADFEVFGHYDGCPCGDPSEASEQLDERRCRENLFEHVLRCCRGDERPIVGGPEGVAVMRILDAADTSAATGGRQVDLTVVP